jgi:restriction system protein
MPPKIPAFGLAGLLIVAILWLYVSISSRRHGEKQSRLKAIGIGGVDDMNALQFVNYVVELLRSQDYAAIPTRASNDLGVDIIASRHGYRIAILCKRTSRRVDKRAVSDVMAGRIHYRCDKAWVVSNSIFSSGAKTLAKNIGIELVDRELLISWIIDFQQLIDI